MWLSPWHRPFCIHITKLLYTRAASFLYLMSIAQTVCSCSPWVWSNTRSGQEQKAPLGFPRLWIRPPAASAQCGGIRHSALCTLNISAARGSEWWPSLLCCREAHNSDKDFFIFFLKGVPETLFSHLETKGSVPKVNHKVCLHPLFLSSRWNLPDS